MEEIFTFCQKHSTETAVHLKTKSYECDICKKSFKNKSNLKTHIDGIHKNLKPFKCSDCKASFTHRCRLKRHMTSIHKKLKSCIICDEYFSLKQDFRKHMAEVHQKFKSFRCNECIMSFKERVNLEKHVLKNHLPDNDLDTKENN